MMILRWTVKSLLREPLALLGGAAAIAAALVLVMLFEAIWQGESSQIIAYVRKADADVWVMQKGVSNMHMATSLLDSWKESQVAEIRGVADVTPILYMNSIVRAGTRNWFAYVVGLESDARRGGPWAIAQGKARANPGEAIIPDMMASISDVQVGDTLQVADMTLRVAGLSKGTFSMANPVLFVHAEDLRDILSAYGFVSYLLVKAQPGVAPEALAARIREDVNDVSALPRDAFVQSDYEMAVMMGADLIGIFTAIGAVLAVMLVAFTLYTHTMRRRRELAILTAIGFRQYHIYSSVLFEAVVLMTAGFVLACLLALGGVFLTSLIAPQITMQLTGTIVAKVGLVGTGVALLATVIPARQIVRIDPQLAFQS